MCGITGFIDFYKSCNQGELKKMTNALQHRGPDDIGTTIQHIDDISIGLGHRRLSILDLSNNGHQPMSFQQYQVVYNGEIYNFKAIRDELKIFGYQFSTECDTEVLLKAFHKWQIKAIDRFIGMFAFAIFDKNTRKLYLIRDRAGVKPLYYYWDNQAFIFASELKSFHECQAFNKKININAVALYFKFGYIPQPHCIFENSYKVKAGHYIEFDCSIKKVIEKEYWNAINFYNQPKLCLTDEEAIFQTDQLLKDTTKHRLIADVPVGVFLSGGFDSSVVTAIAQKQSDSPINTFTIGFNEKHFDESKVAKQIAKHLGTNHTEYICTSSELKSQIQNLSYYFDEPFGDASALPTLLVSQIAKNNVGVSLSADGGDELFAGYNKYRTILNYYNNLENLPNAMKVVLKKLLDVIPPINTLYNFDTKTQKFKDLLASHGGIAEYLKITSYLNGSSWINNLLNFKAQNVETNFDIANLNFNNQLDELLALDYRTYLVDDILVKVDRASMAHSLEAREPLLDHRLLEFVARLPNNMKSRGSNQKWLLKQVAYQYIPQSLLDRPKQGFSVPLKNWLYQPDLKQQINFHLSKAEINKYGILNYAVIGQLLADFNAKKNISIRRVWLILMFQKWCEQWLK